MQYFTGIADDIHKLIQCAIKINQYLANSNSPSMNFTCHLSRLNILLFFLFSIYLLVSFCCPEDELSNTLKLTTDALKLKKQLLEGTAVGSNYLTTL